MTSPAEYQAQGGTRGGFIAVVGVTIAILIAAAVLFGWYTPRTEAREALRMKKFSFVLAVGSARIEDYVVAKTGKSSGGAYGKLRGAEIDFMETCQRCASADACERDRLTIRAGTSADSYNPCD